MLLKAAKWPSLFARRSGRVVLGRSVSFKNTTDIVTVNRKSRYMQKNISIYVYINLSLYNCILSPTNHLALRNPHQI